MPLLPSKETFQSYAFFSYYQDVGEKMITKLNKFKLIMRINPETLRFAAGMELSNVNKNNKGFTSLPADVFFLLVVFDEFDEHRG